MELRFGVEIESALALAVVPGAALELDVTSLTSVCVEDAIWVSSPSESNWANSTVNWLGSTGSSGLWFWSCTDSNCKNVCVKSTPGSLDEDEDEEVGDDDEVVDDAEAV